MASNHFLNVQHTVSKVQQKVRLAVILLLGACTALSQDFFLITLQNIHGVTAILRLSVLKLGIQSVLRQCFRKLLTIILLLE